MIPLIISIIALSCAVFIGVPAFILAIYAFIKINILLGAKHEVHLIKDNEIFKKDPEQEIKQEKIKAFRNELEDDLGIILE